jgi:thiol:disulfide interchange protein
MPTSPRKMAFSVEVWLKMKFKTAFLFFVLIVGFLTFVPTAVVASDRSDVEEQENVSHTTAQLVADVKSIKPGVPFKLGALLKQELGWHTYYKESGDAGMPTKIIWELPKGYTASDLLWEQPNKFDDGGIVTYGYQNHNLVAATITPPKGLSGQQTIKATVKWLSCKDACIPGEAKVSLVLPASDAQPQPSPQAADFAKVGWSDKLTTLSDSEPPTKKENSTAIPVLNKSDTTGSGGSFLDKKFDVQGEKQQSLPVYLLFAFLGGFILNFMPCVLPVIALKVCSMVDSAHEDSNYIRIHGVTFASGMIATFLAIAVAILIVQSTGQSVGWGFLFQYPAFLIGMSVIVLLFSLSLFGMFYINLPGASQHVDQLARKEGLPGTFFKGVLATVLSTPCTAPFLGTAVGFALTQNAFTVLSIFFTIGLGMASPYVILMLKPEWIKFIPKPGTWMERFKESMGFVLLVTVLWLLYVLGSLVGSDGVVRTLGFLIAISFATWLINSFTSLRSKPSTIYGMWGMALLVVAMSFYLCYASQPGYGLIAQQQKLLDNLPESASAIQWRPYKEADLNSAVAENKAVMLDFTADWCLTCKVNERTVLQSAPVIDKLKALKVVTMKVDWTTQDPVLTKLLNKFNRSGVPLYVIFPARNATAPIVLPEVITPELVVEKLNEAGPSQ